MYSICKRLAIAHLRMLIAAAAVAPLLFAASGAQAQSVIGSGAVYDAEFGYVQFAVNAYLDRNGHARGTVTYTEASGATFTYRVQSVVVSGNSAAVDVSENGRRQTAGTFYFTDNGDGSVLPDYFGFRWFGCT